MLLQLGEQISSTLRATILTWFDSLQRRAQQLRLVSTICNILYNKSNVFSLSSTLRDTFLTCVNYLNNIAGNNLCVYSLSSILHAIILVCISYLWHQSAIIETWLIRCNFSSGNSNCGLVSVTLREVAFHSHQLFHFSLLKPSLLQNETHQNVIS